MKQNQKLGPDHAFASAQKLLKLGNLGAGGSRKKVVKNPTEEKILEVGEDPGDQSTAWRQVLGHNQRPWPLTLETGTCEQFHNITQQVFVSVLSWPADTSLWGGTLRPEEHSTGGEGENKCVRK